MATTCADLVGREEEFSAIVGFLEATRVGPSALLLEGEVGIGKSTLWRAAVATAQESGFCILAARPASAEAALSYVGLADLLNAHLDVLGELPEPQRHALEVALLLAEPAGLPPDQRAIGAGLLNVLRLLARKGPVLIGVDDISWLDTASLAVVKFVARRLRDEPVGLLLTNRSDRVPSRSLDGLSPEGGVHRLLVGPLLVDGLYRVLHKELGVVLSRLALRRIHEAARGNPFLALELARALERGGRELETGLPVPIPERLRDLVGDRIATLPVETVDVLFAVAALTRPTVGVIGAAIAGGVLALEPAVRAGVIELNGDRIRFSHPLLASAAFAEVAIDHRRELYRGLAAVVAEPEERARYLAFATDRPDSEIATALDVAAIRAASRGAPAEAAELAELAAMLTPSLSIDARWLRWIVAADHHATAGQMERVRSILEPIVEEMPPGHERARALFLLGWSDTLSGRGEARYEQALREAGPDDSLCARIHRRLGFARVYAGDLPSARLHADEALERSNRAGDRLTRAKSFSLRLLLDVLAGRPIVSSQLDEALAFGGEMSPSFYYQPNVVGACLLMFRGRLDDARSILLDAYRTATDHGNEEVSSTCLLHLARLECRAGNWLRAADLARAGHELTQQQGIGDRQGVLVYARALVAAHLGTDEARKLAEDAVAVLEASGNALWEIEARSVLGFCELSAGDAFAAVQVLAPLPARLRAGGFGEPSHLQALPNLVEALVEIGEAQRAPPLIQWLEQQGRLLDSPLARSQAARSRGLVASANGSVDVAIGYLETALQENQRMPEPFELGRTLLALGSVQRRARQLRVARQSLGRAAAIFDELGAVRWAAKTNAQLARIGGRSAAPDDLTPAERRVAELVAQGKSNQQVAAELFVTVRTVESSLTKAYRKLGVRSRSELAHRFIER